MRTTRLRAGRRAGLLAAAVLVSLTTGCGPDLGALAAGGPPPAAGAGSGSPAPAELGAPSTGVPTEPTPPSLPDGAAELPPAPADPPVAAPAEEPAAPPAAEPDVAAGEQAAGSRPSAAQPSVPQPAPAAPPRAAAVGAVSGGTGGPFTDQARTSYTARNGLTGRYLRYAGGVDPTRPVGLIVYADGTGEYGVDNPTSSYALGGPAGLVAVGKARNMVTLAVESPDQGCECWHTGNTAGYADFLAELVETQGIGAYPVTEVWLVGFSSGAQEITRFLVPRHPELLRLGGGWVVFGGGGPPAGGSVQPGALSGTHGHWVTGTADTAVPLTASWGAQAGERYYAERGMSTSHEWPAGGGHGLDGRLGRTVAAQIDAH